MKRKLVTFARDYYEKGKYHISFAYYDDMGNFLEWWEQTELTEQELYVILKPKLVKKEAK